MFPNNGKLKIVPIEKFHRIPSYGSVVEDQVGIGQFMYHGHGFKLLGIPYKQLPDNIAGIKDKEAKERAVEAFQSDPGNVVERVFYRALLPVQGPFVAVYDDSPAPLLFWIHETYLMSCPLQPT